MRWESEALVCQIKPKSWPVNRKKWLGGWYLHNEDRAWGGTTPSPHAVFYGPDRTLGKTKETWVQVQRHEHVHVEQGEATQLGSFLTGAIVAALGHPFIGLAIWVFGGYVRMGIEGWTTAWLKGLSPYAGSYHEKSAYSQMVDKQP